MYRDVQVHAAVASSAPVNAVPVEMSGYYDSVADAYSVEDNGVGGSAACTMAISRGHAQIGEALLTKTGRTLLTYMKACACTYIHVCRHVCIRLLM